MDRERDLEIDDIDKMMSRIEEVDRALDHKLFEVAEGDKAVIVTANGHGVIVGMTIAEEARKHPTRLSDQVTSAVNRASRVGRELSKQAVRKYFPNFPAMDDLLHEMALPSYSTDYHAIDYDGCREARNRLARHNETIRKMREAAEQFKRQSVSQEIEGGMGKVVLRMDGSRLEVNLLPVATSRACLAGSPVGLARLADRIVVAINRGHVRAAEFRLKTVERIQRHKDLLG